MSNFAVKNNKWCCSVSELNIINNINQEWQIHKRKIEQLENTIKVLKGGN